jgi:hypothetical protein
VYSLPPHNTVPATMETLALPLVVTMQRNNTGVVSVSMELFDYSYLATMAFSQTRHNIISVSLKREKTWKTKREIESDSRKLQGLLA